MSEMPDHYRKLENLYHHSAPINRFYEPRLRVGDGVARLEVDVKPELWHAAHAVHGSVYFKMLDDAAFFAANSVVRDVFLLTSSFHIQLLRPVTVGVLESNGTLRHRSRAVFVADAELFNDGKLVGRGSGTFMRSSIALNPDVGYVP